ncbi:MAG: dUTP diphosphatase [Spirochaetes bacterium]|nr:MAG: dUTP diphosphatase [Spirochaetota bacterium]RKX88660.1 MAG: dUTP diphosphatase [Spirochaetota bacterium]RKX99094.1 MAG: dUTP diphosphatase [Spirochaetota bacterium]
MVFSIQPEDVLIEKNKPVVLFTGKPEMAPAYATGYAAGADLKADLIAPVDIKPGERLIVPTGIHMAIPPGYEGQVRPRSGLAFKKGLTVLNSPGTIDADYRGEVKVILVNLGHEKVSLSPGERIAQLIIAEVSSAVFTLSRELPDSDRGSGGFGSTGA